MQLLSSLVLGFPIIYLMLNLSQFRPVMLPHHFKQVNAMDSLSLAAVAKKSFSDRSTQVYSLLLAVTLAIYMVGALHVAPEVLSSTSMPDVSVAIMWCAFGWFLYLVQEYISHVWIFHMSPPKSLNGYRLLYRLHMGDRKS